MDTNLLSSPLADWHLAQNAKMVPFASMMLPVQYAGLKAEHLATREDHGLFDISHMVQIAITAEDQDILDQAMHRVFPIDIANMHIGDSRYSFLLNDQGGILDDVIVSKTENGYFVVVNGARRDHDPAFLREKLPDTVAIAVQEDRAFLALQGPKATSYLQKLLPDLPDITFMHTTEIIWHDQPIRLFRQGYTGEDGWEISLPASIAIDFVERLAALGTLNPCGLGARDSLRLEAGLPLWGNDIDADTTPLMAGLGFAIAKSRREDRCFLGAEAVCAQFTTPPAQKRWGIVSEGRQPIRAGTLIFAGDQQVGRVTSGGLSPSLDTPIALVIGDREYATPEQKLEAEIRGKRLPVTVTRTPFINTRYYSG